MTKLQNDFQKRPLIYKGKGSTDKGAITLGWKFELLNVKSGQLSEKIDLTRQQVIDVYADTNLSEDKRNAYVNDVIIKDSGVANFIIVGKEYKITGCNPYKSRGFSPFPMYFCRLIY